MDKASDSERDERVVEAAKTKELFGALLASEAWHKLQDIVKARAANIQHSILSQPIGADDSMGIYKQEFRKGHAIGLLEVELLVKQELGMAEEIFKLEEDEDAAE